MESLNLEKLYSNLEDLKKKLKIVDEHIAISYNYDNEKEQNLFLKQLWKDKINILNEIGDIEHKIWLAKNPDLKKITQELEIIEAKFNEIANIKDFNEMYKKESQLREKKYKLLKKKGEIEHTLYFSLPPIKNNDLIDLRINRSTYDYSIYLHNTTTYIGNISYRGYHIEYFGDIGYNIFPEFQKNHYAYEALVLLSEKLYEDGIPDFWITVYPDNIPSIKTIEKYGGKLESKIEHSILLFKCETNKRKQTKSPVI